MTSDELDAMLKENGRTERRVDMSEGRQDDTRAAARELLDVHQAVEPGPRIIAYPVRSIAALAAALVAAALIGVYVSSRSQPDAPGPLAGVDDPGLQDAVAQVPPTVAPGETQDGVIEDGVIEDLGPLVPMAWPPPPPRVWGDAPSALDSFSQRMEPSGVLHGSGAPVNFKSRSSTLKSRIRDATREVRSDLNDLNDTSDTTRGQRGYGAPLMSVVT